MTPPGSLHRRRRRVMAAGLAAALAAACHGKEAGSPPPQPVLEQAAAGADATYLRPPTVVGVRSVAGGVSVTGQAPAGAVVQLASPEGDLVRALAGPKGTWSLTLPLGPAPRLFAVSAAADGRTLRAEGALLLAPGALSPAVILRAGAAALPLAATGEPRLDIATVDYDPSGFMAVAGRAPPGGDVTLTLDGAAAAQGHADDQGRYALLAAGRRLAMGAHRLMVTADRDSATRSVTLTPPSSLGTPYAAARTAEGWRVEWALTGGGVQTTLVLGP